MDGKDKRSSLLGAIVNYGQKYFITFAPGHCLWCGPNGLPYLQDPDKARFVRIMANIVLFERMLLRQIKWRIPEPAKMIDI